MIKCSLCLFFALLTYCAETVRILGVESRFEETIVYNFDIDDFHTYAVGSREVLVHNSSMELLPPQPNKGQIKIMSDSHLRELGIDAHELKEACPGPPSLFDIYLDKATGILWGFRKGGKGEGTYLRRLPRN